MEIAHRMLQRQDYRLSPAAEHTIGMDLFTRSESLALVQLLILYHLVTGRAAVALGRPELARMS